MKTYYKILVFSLLVCIFVSGCGAKAPAATATQDAAALAAAQTAQAPTSTHTPEPSATATSTATPTETAIPTETPDASATSVAATHASYLATQQANQTATAVSSLATQQAVDAVWSLLKSDGTVSYKQGKTYDIDDFEQSWAQRGWYNYWPFGYNMGDFVIMSHIDWEIPENANFGQGGCGFLVRIQNEDNHLVVFLSPRGYPELGAMTPSGFAYQSYHWQNPDNPNFLTIAPAVTGSADFVVVVEKEYVTGYVDGVKIYQYYVALTSPGDMGYTLVSGTNKDFGIYCKFSNTTVTNLVKP